VSFEELKQRQSVVWGAGEYQSVTETIADMHQLVLERLAPQSGERWLDLACGTGAVAELAARTGAQVTGVDLAPALIETAKRRAAEQRLEIDYQVGDCERLEAIADGEFDIVSSTCGIMFGPDHQATARELARVTRSGGRIGLANWEPEGGVHEMFRMIAPFAPPPPEGAGVPFDWGDEDHVRELLGNDFDLRFEHHVSTMELESGEEYWRLFSESFGPVKILADSLEADLREDLHNAWVDFFDKRYSSHGHVAHPREYLLVLGTRR
jgi:SAM-dependent methyltransferase